MAEGSVKSKSRDATDDALRQALARGDAVLESAEPVLRYLLSNEEKSLFADEVIASIRGMLGDLGQQLIQAVSEVAENAMEEFQQAKLVEALVDQFLSNGEILTHLHALSLEVQLTNKLESLLGLPPVHSPLLQSLLVDSTSEVAAGAVLAMTAQARFMQSQRRMQLPLRELPGDILHAVLLSLRELESSELGNSADLALVESNFRQGYDESTTRLALISRLIAAMRTGASAALNVSHAGVAMFLTGLAIASDQERDSIALATIGAQSTRFALTMRAAGLNQAEIAEQIELLHPDVKVKPWFADLQSDEAAALLSRSVAYVEA